ncbi:uncharacterized protein LOC132202319 isoform X1 [Neocloeon triangulifer]|uniref:uncharacterized protein LOC132202319 isoform X1 n=1 Tax=Neocloeon triangulifer TaxID=2078957 RepID=UPI00286F4025|nr:uncharacterized protein LOC132202319 isoform X1 [Neocloeon triangulifer]
MVCHKNLVFLFSLLATAVASISLPETTPETNCGQSCLHQFNENAVARLSDACQRGCRFYELVSSANGEGGIEAVLEGLDLQQHLRVNTTKETCQSSCMEAYRHTKERYACHQGCAHMARDTARAEERLRQEVLQESARDLASLGPLLSSMLGRARFALLFSSQESKDSVLLVQQQEPPKPPRHTPQPPSDILGCLSNKYGLPKWFFGLLGLATGLLAGWLCYEPMKMAAILEEKEALLLLDEEADDLPSKKEPVA